MAECEGGEGMVKSEAGRVTIVRLARVAWNEAGKSHDCYGQKVT